MDTISKVVLASDIYETENTDLKKEYLKGYIKLFNQIAESLPGFKGSFGLGYPFYTLGKNFEGDLPIIDEQLRYNEQLLDDYIQYGDRSTDWKCEECLRENSDTMPDLKTVCYSCPIVHKEISPRKIINRLPDMDFCLVVEDGYEMVTQDKLITLFKEKGIETSDVDPLKTIDKVYNIANDLKNGVMPKDLVPIDAHLFSYGEMNRLLDNVVPCIVNHLDKGVIPYLPTSPWSLRKTWQKDDQAMNFIFDYLFSLTEYKFESKLLSNLQRSRRELVSLYDNETIEEITLETSPDSLPRRYQTPTLRKVFNERINEWRDL